MSLSDFIAVMRPEIEDELKDACSRLIPASAVGMEEMIMYHMGWAGEGAGLEAQGKRIRPILLLLCAAAAGGDWHQALPAAAGVELLHNFSLIHDDIEDHSDLRHGRPTVWKKWGIAQAINTGDAMFAMAFLAVMRLDRACPLKMCYSASKILMNACMDLTAGQHLDISYENERSIPLSAYWPMVQGKTAALLAACAEIGALVGGANTRQQSHFHQFGNALGLAFQSLDDVLGIWGNEALTGKSAQSDLLTGKKTLPIAYALELNGTFADRWKAGPIRLDEVVGITDLLEREGAHSFAESEADRYTSVAVNALNAAAEDSPALAALHELADILLMRTH